MKLCFVVGNWKSNKTVDEAEDWVAQFATLHAPIDAERVIVVLCVPFTLLFPIKKMLDEHHVSIALGAQDVSPYAEGAYTGEVNAKQIKEMAEWVIVGHSERRKWFHESDDILKQKVDQARQAGLRVIYCVPDDQASVPDGVAVVAYEPVWAIGTGKADTPDNASHVIAEIKKKLSKETSVIYGGSVKPDNVSFYMKEAAIDGVLPGGASLDPNQFSQLIASASSL